jgi:hypothetical protein
MAQSRATDEHEAVIADPVEFDSGADRGPRKWRREWASAVMRTDGLTPAAWVTALVMVERASEAERTFAASSQSLADITGRTRQAEHDHVTALRAAGWIEWTGRHQNHRRVWRLVRPDGYRPAVVDGSPSRSRLAVVDSSSAPGESRPAETDVSCPAVVDTALVNSVDAPAGGRRASAREPDPVDIGQTRAVPPRGSGGSERADHSADCTGGFDPFCEGDHS